MVKTGRIPGRGEQKHFLFGKPSNEMPIEVPLKLINLYRDQLTQGQKSILGNEGVLGTMQPVFYLWENDELTFFGNAMMFRLPYENTPLDLVPESIRNDNEIDITDRIFGFVKNSQRRNEASRAGRVSFSDANLDRTTDDIWLASTSITPQILGGPKPTTFQHYLVQDKNHGHDPDDKTTLAHYNTDSPNETVIRGHKMSWHKNNIPAQIDH